MRGDTGIGIGIGVGIEERWWLRDGWDDIRIWRWGRGQSWRRTGDSQGYEIKAPWVLL
jgi:hypothetical protein